MRWCIYKSYKFHIFEPRNEPLKTQLVHLPSLANMPTVCLKRVGWGKGGRGGLTPPSENQGTVEFAGKEDHECSTIDAGLRLTQNHFFLPNQRQAFE